MFKQKIVMKHFTTLTLIVAISTGVFLYGGSEQSDPDRSTMEFSFDTRLFFVRGEKNTRVSLFKIIGLSRESLERQYKEFKTATPIGSFHIDQKSRREFIRIVFSEGEIGAAAWNVVFDQNLEIVEQNQFTIKAH